MVAARVDSMPMLAMVWWLEVVDCATVTAGVAAMLGQMDAVVNPVKRAGESSEPLDTARRGCLCWEAVPPGWRGRREGAASLAWQERLMKGQRAPLARCSP